MQVLSHSGQVVPHLDADLAQVGCRADARQHEQLRRPDRTRADQHLDAGTDAGELAAVAVGDADRAVAVQVDARRERVGLHGEFRTLARGVEVGPLLRPAPPLAAGHLVEPGAFLLRAVEVVEAGEPVGDPASTPADVIGWV